MKKPFVLIAAIVAVVGLATTAQSGLADEGAAVSSKDEPAVRCWTTFPARGGEAKPKVAPTRCLFAGRHAQSFDDEGPAGNAIGGFSLSWRQWGAPRALGEGKACSSLSGPSPNGCASVTFILKKLRYKASCQQRMYTKVRFKVEGDADFTNRYGGCP